MFDHRPIPQRIQEHGRSASMIHRRDFLALAGGGLATMSARRLLAQAESRDEALPAPRVVLTWGTNGDADGEFDIPIAIAINHQDEIFVSDFRQSDPEARAREQRFDTEGRFLGSFELEPMPGGLAFDNEGLLYATHMMRHKVTVCDQAGKLVREFRRLGTEPGEFQQPGGIAFGPDGSVGDFDEPSGAAVCRRRNVSARLGWRRDRTGRIQDPARAGVGQRGAPVRRRFPQFENPENRSLTLPVISNRDQ